MGDNELSKLGRKGVQIRSHLLDEAFVFSGARAKLQYGVYSAADTVRREEHTSMSRCILLNFPVIVTQVTQVEMST